MVNRGSVTRDENGVREEDHTGVRGFDEAIYGAESAQETTDELLLSRPKEMGRLDRFQKWKPYLEKLDKEWLIMPKLIYLSLNCAIYASHNYTAMYFYKMWGLEVYQFGAVSSLSAIQFVGALFWAHLADQTGRHKSILLVCTVLYAFFFCLLELKPFDGNGSLTAKIVYSAIMYGVSCFFLSSLFPMVDAQIFSILAKDPNFTKETFGRQRLWGTVGHGLVTLAVGISIYWIGYIGMFLMLILTCFFFIICVVIGIPSDVVILKKSETPKAALPENIVCKICEQAKIEAEQSCHCDGVHDRNTTATILGQEETDPIGKPESPNNHKQKTPYGNAVIVIGTDNTGSASAPGANSTITCAKECANTPAIRLLFDPHFFFLALVILAAGYVRSVMSSFLGFYMQKEMDQGEIMVAVAIMFRMISEIGIFFYNKQLLNLIGIHWMLIVAQVAGLLRVFAYSALPTGGNWFYWSFAIELLKGASTGCLISSAVRMANDIAPKGCAHTAQAYISGIYSGLALAIGGALGGLIIYILPGHNVAGMFRVTFWMGLVALILCILKYTFIDRAIILEKR